MTSELGKRERCSRSCRSRTTERGIRRDDHSMLAFAYTTPILALIHLCDRRPVKTEGATAKTEAFSRRFISTCGVKERCLI